MPASFTTARDDMLSAFTVKWNADTPAVNGGVIPEVRYDGRGESTPPPHDAAWARIKIRHLLGGETAIGGHPGSLKRTTKLGVLTVQIFAPYTPAAALPPGVELAEPLAEIAKAAFETKVTANDVIFRNVRPIEVGDDSGTWYQINVLADFEYDEFV